MTKYMHTKYLAYILLDLTLVKSYEMSYKVMIEFQYSLCQGEVKQVFLKKALFSTHHLDRQK